jgi:tetratricopeptide (TPR) repeat protein/transglutaminase-like putative cysteine protease
MRHRLLCCLPLLWAGCAISAQQPAKPAAAATKPDYSQQQVVFESITKRYRFENDGGGWREFAARIKVQSEAGVQQWGVLQFGYNAGNEKVDIEYVRVRKPDGSVVNTGPDNVQDVTSAISKQAPMYSDFREKHITVPGLRPGDTLEYDMRATTTSPLIPGQFWLTEDPTRDAIVLDETIEVNVPSGRAVTIKSDPKLKASKNEEGGRTTYVWHTSQLEPPYAGGDSKVEKTRAQELRAMAEAPPAIELSTFSSWQQLGRWYFDLQNPRAGVTPEIAAKAAELTKDKKTEADKARAIYDYVATNIRYISLLFGVGRFQPHAATEVLANKYGDCKDKSTLLQALLAAVGIKAEPVLINSERKLDSDVPSPAQFNHLITMAYVGEAPVLLDTTAEVAPYGYLLPVLDHKQALLVAAAAPTLIETPAVGPVRSFQRIRFEGKVNELAALAGTISIEARGAAEVTLRAVLRRVPESSWSQVLTIAGASFGVPGEAKDVKAGDPAGIDVPFTLSWSSTNSSYTSFVGRKAAVSVPLPSGGLPGVDEKEPDKIKFGEPVDIVSTAKIEFPAGYKISLPMSVHLTRDYGEYASDYRVDGSTVMVERKLRINVPELPQDRTAEYAAFRRVVSEEERQTLSIEAPSNVANSIPSTATAEEYYESGTAAFQSGNYQRAADLLKLAVAADAKHKSAWNNLGRAHLALRRYDDALAAFQKQIEVNPYDEWSYNNMGRVYVAQGKYPEAEKAFKKQLEINPLDRYSHGNLGDMYIRWKKYPEAITEFQAQQHLDANNVAVKNQLAVAYLGNGETSKALSLFDEVVSAAPNAWTWNNVAYALAEQGVALDRAIVYARSAIGTIATATRMISSTGPTLQELASDTALAAYWDTLGWIYMKQGDLAGAERYVRAAWLLAQDPVVGDHLGQIYEKLGRKQDAIHAYALAVAAAPVNQDFQKHLNAAVGNDAKTSRLQSQAVAQLGEERTYKVAVPGFKDRSSAQFYVALVNGPKVAAITFVSGDPELKSATKALEALSYRIEFPDDTAVKVVRRGIVACSQASGCSFALMPWEEMLREAPSSGTSASAGTED